MHLPSWLRELGFEVKEVRPIVEATKPGEPKWTWLAAFIENGRKRMESLGTLSTEQSKAIGARLAHLEGNVETRMITPALLEIIATRR
jgi:DNA-binding transcriptional MerR regulator